jgi:hypothetical protein
VKECSHALSEYLRVVGFLPKAQGLDRFERAVTVWVEPFTRDSDVDQVSIAFAYLSAGRSLVLLDKAQDALRYLNADDISWELTPSHLISGRFRWLARAYDQLGDVQAAAATRQEIARRTQGPGGSDWKIQQLLSDLDSCVHRCSDWAAALEALRGSNEDERVEIGRHDDGTASIENARVVADGYRY